MRSLGIVIVVAVVVIGCSEILAALGPTVDIPADSYSVAEGRTWQIPLNISGCDPSECLVTWRSDNECVVSFGTGASATAVHFGTARVDVEAVRSASTKSDHAVVTVTQQTPVRLQLAERLLPLAPGLTGVLWVKLFNAS